MPTTGNPTTDAIPDDFQHETRDPAIICTTPEGLITAWNGGAGRIFGYSAGETIGRPFSILTDEAQAFSFSSLLQVSTGSGSRYQAEKLRRSDGTLIETYLAVSPIQDPENAVSGILLVAREAREIIGASEMARKAERDQLFLAAIVSSAEDGIISKDLDGVVTSWNKAAERIFGYTAEEMIGKPVTVLIASDHPDEEPRILSRIRRGERIEHYETRRLRKDGSLIDVSLTVSPIRDGFGRIVGASKIARNITAEKQASIRERETLRQATEARRMAEAANRTKDEFLATVSHELRTPMTAIVGWSRLLLSGQLSPDLYSKAFEVIDRNARSQAQLIEDLLDVSRIMSGKLRVEFAPVDLAEVVAAAAESVRHSAETKGIRIVTVLSSDAVPVLGDFERLQQVVWNLLSNAIRFTQTGGTVRVEVQRVESQIQLRVTDNGSGINPEFLPRIFDRFTQADSSLTRSASGLGMGLAIVKSLIELHGGMIAASSPGEGKGAVFTARLPVSALRRPEKPARILPDVDSVLSGSELVGIKILVVDDDADASGLMRFVFDKAGAIVETAGNAEAALKVLDRWNPDILVSDIGMPGVDGYEFIRIVREERRSRIPAVALTALARIDDRMRALNAGYQMHVSKPVEPSELVSIVASLTSLIDRRPAV